MSNYDYFRDELRPIIENYPKETCPVCLDNQSNDSISARSAKSTQHGLDIIIPVCSSCKDKCSYDTTYNGRTITMYEGLSEYLGFMTHFAVYSSSSTQLDTDSISGDLRLQKTTFVEDETGHNKTLEQYINDNRDQIDILLEENIHNTELALIYNKHESKLAVIYVDSGITLVLDDISIEAPENSDPCCIEHFRFTSLNGFIKYLREQEDSVWTIKHLPNEL